MTTRTQAQAMLEAYAEEYFCDTPEWDEIGEEYRGKLTKAVCFLDIDRLKTEEDDPDLDGKTLLKAYRKNADSAAPDWNDLSEETRQALLDAQDMIHKVAREFEEESEQISKMLADRRAKLHKRRG